MKEMFEGLRVSVCLIFFVYASLSDYKTREVSNRVWVFFAPIAFVLTSLQLFLFSSDLQQAFFMYAFSFIVTSVLAIAIFYAGGFGGADAKALICLSLAIPFYPENLARPFANFVSPIFPLGVFCNAVLLAALSVFYALLRNFVWRLRTEQKLFEGLEGESFGRKFLTLLCGYKVSLGEFERNGHMYPLEDLQTVDGKVKRRLLVVPKDEERSSILERISKATHEGNMQGEIWATPGLAMLIFITLGLVAGLIFGDLIWYLLRLFFG